VFCRRQKAANSNWSGHGASTLRPQTMYGDPSHKTDFIRSGDPTSGLHYHKMDFLSSGNPSSRVHEAHKYNLGGSGGRRVLAWHIWPGALQSQPPNAADVQLGPDSSPLPPGYPAIAPRTSFRQFPIPGTAVGSHTDPANQITAPMESAWKDSTRTEPPSPGDVSAGLDGPPTVGSTGQPCLTAGLLCTPP
jgi:hypothetical protein